LLAAVIILATAVVSVCDLQTSGSCMKRLALFTDGTHNDTWQCNSYYDVLSRFLTEVCKLQVYAIVCFLLEN